jgi:hypothetical protein
VFNFLFNKKIKILIFNVWIIYNFSFLGHVGHICLLQNFLQCIAVGVGTQDKRHQEYIDRVFLQLLYHNILTMSFRNSPVSSSLMSLFIYISLMTSTTSLPLAFHCLCSYWGIKHLPLRVNPLILVWNIEAGLSILGKFI